MKKVGVIGAGLGGLSIIRHLQEHPDRFQVQCFDRATQIGGEWVYMDSTKDNAFGARANALYDNLRTNGFREATQLLDHPFEDGVPLWPTWRDMEKHIASYAQTHDLHQYVQLNTQVEHIAPCGEKWRVITRNLTSGHQEWTFDVIVVCIGLYHRADIPEIPGKNTFKGSAIHSYQYRSPSPYTDRSVLVVGAGPSGHDIVLDVAKTAKNVYCSAKEWFFKITAATSHVEMVPLISRFTETGVVLTDERNLEVDDVIFCTGYTREFPFLDAACHVTVKNKRITPLYKGIVHTEFPSSCFFLGLKEFNNYVGTVSVQTRFVTSVLLGNADLPSAEVMNAEIAEELRAALREGKPPKTCHYLAFNQANYCAELETVANIPRSPVSMWKAMEALIEDFVVKYDFHILRYIKYIVKDDTTFERIYPTKNE